jgi:tetratricopeptide (TPR) repeat protein
MASPTLTGPGRLTRWAERAFALVTILVLVADVRAAAAPTTNQMAAECTAFANAFAKLVPIGGMPGHEAFDVETLTVRAAKLLPDSAGQREKIRVAMQAAVDKMVASLQGSKLHYLRLRETGGETRALIRVNGKEGTLNYLELVCEMRLMKRIKVVDVYNLSTGELLTESLQRLMSVLDPEMSLIDRLTGKQREVNNRMKTASDLFQLSQAGDHKGVVKRFGELPPELQRQKVFIVLRTKSASKVSNEEYLAAMNFWRATYPNDASIDLISIDAFLLRTNYDQALAAVDRLDTALDGDPYLDYMRAGILRKMGNTEEANALRAKALAAENPAAGGTSRAWSAPAPAPNASPAAVPPSVRMAAQANAKATMRLQGVFLRTGTPTAIINGKNLAEGDSLDGNKIMKIEAQRVTLQNEAGEQFKLTYQ